MSQILTYYCHNCREVITTREYKDINCEHHHCSKCGLFLFSVNKDDPVLNGTTLLEDPPNKKENK